MNNPEGIVNHTLNSSTSKQAFSFSKSNRFIIKKRQKNNMYSLPSTLNKRTCTFGFGQKTDLTDKKVLPPPGAYYSDSNESTSKRLNTISFSLGRNQVKFGSFLNEVYKKKSIPSPNKYKNSQNTLNSQFGKIGTKLTTEIDLVMKVKTPGPGAYSLSSTQLKTSGKYKLSKFKNPLFPRLHSPFSNSSNDDKKNTIGPGQYENERGLGHSILSQWKKSVGVAFTKSNRDLEGKNVPETVGYKYNSFSQFSGQNV